MRLRYEVFPFDIPKAWSQYVESTIAQYPSSDAVSAFGLDVVVGGRSGSLGLDPHKANVLW